MSNETNRIRFKPKAHILILLGEELIKNPVMAIYELIKNSYDADARMVTVDFKNADDTNSASIIIHDDGTGITEDVLKNVWFEPGTDFRKPIQKDGTRVISKTPEFDRVPMGEKGVGRFAVHKLSNVIKLISRPAKVIKNDNGEFVRRELYDYEIEVHIDWQTFSQKKYLKDVSISWKKVTNKNEFKFIDNSGTRIELTSLKEPWTRGMARQLKRHTITMVSPKNDYSKFKVELDFNNAWLDEPVDYTGVLEAAPYVLTAFLDQEYNLTFEYKFSLLNKPELDSRLIDKPEEGEKNTNKYQRNIRNELRPFVRAYFQKIKELNDDEIDEKLDDFLAKQLPFGSLLLELVSFDLDPDSLRDSTSDASLVRSLLKEHAGMKVFKGNLRVYDYGEPGNDWLGLDLKRVQNKEWFSNNQIIGYIYLDPEKSGALVEKTNREGFIQNDAFDKFTLSLEFILNEFKAERSSDRKRWLDFNNNGISESFEYQVSALRLTIDNANIPDANVKRKILSEVKRIETRYEQDKNTLLIPAGVGMTASFAIHEIEKLVPRMKETVKEKPFNHQKIQDQVDELNDYVSGILSILKKSTIKEIPLFETIEQATRNYSLKLRRRNIDVVFNHDKSIDFIKCDRRLLITILMNLIDNSIYWLETVSKPKKSIFISTRRFGNSLSILVVDNGPGFRDKIEDIVKPFFSRKEGGIGIGMYLIDTAMMQFGRLNIILDNSELEDKNVPSEYDGAAVELIFNNQSNA